MQIAILDQRLVGLDEFADERVSAVSPHQKSSFVSGGAELTPGQLLERLGFTSAQLSTPVKDLSGGQKRRLQLLLILLDEPNVLILDEPTNDLDTDMLAAMEDLLDSWPGTLLVVSHDRYLIERVTDQQYAILDRRLRHLPGGVEEYLRIRRICREAGRPDRRSSSRRSRRVETAMSSAAPPAATPRRSSRRSIAASPSWPTPSGAQHDEFAAHDQGDYEGLGRLQGRRSASSSPRRQRSRSAGSSSARSWRLRASGYQPPPPPPPPPPPDEPPPPEPPLDDELDDEPENDDATLDEIDPTPAAKRRR